jgi:hypothetical protein
MKRSATGDSVEACGPLLWNGDQPHDRPASSLTIKSVEIKQGNARASTSPNLRLQRAPEPADWMVGDIPAEGSEKFGDGHAQAEAEVEVVLEDGRTDTEHWRERVELST